MSEVRNLKPESVFGYFDDICGIPHGSGNMEAISAYYVNFAKEHQIQYRTDEAKNVIMVKEATPGYENEPAVILQAHIDMVCTKTEDCTIDMSCEPIRPYVDGDLVKADGTTLGADNGIGAAMILAVLADNELAHPRIEALLTTDEETSMFGAKTVDMSDFTARRMINLDSEIEGIFTISSSGGATIDMKMPMEREAAEGKYTKVSVSGLKGGHSGSEIHTGLANANILLGRALKHLDDNKGIRLVSVHGGKAHNVVSNYAEAYVLSDFSATELSEALADFNAMVKNECQDTDPNVVVKCDEASCTLAPLTKDCQKKVVTAMFTALHGVQDMSFAIDGLVETSLNYAIVDVNETEYSATVSVRSSIRSKLDFVVAKVIAVAELLGISCEAYNYYPEWAFVKDSPLRDKCIEVYEKMYGESPEVVALHAGLECGIFSQKLPDLDTIAVGPNLHAVHTSDESMEISSVARVYDYLLEVLAKKDNN